MNSYGKINSVLEQIYEQGGQIHIDSDTWIEGDLHVNGALTANSGGGSSSTKIENGTGKIELLTASKIETKLNNTIVSEQESKTATVDGVVYTTHFSSDSFFLEELVYNVQQQYPFTALMNATSIIKIGVDISYVGSPTVKISIVNTGGAMFATSTVQLPNNATLTETTYPFIGFTMSQNIVEGDNYLLLLTRIDNTPANTINLYGTGVEDYNSVGTINPHSRVDFLIRGTGSHTPKIHHKFNGRLEVGEVYSVEDAIHELQSHHVSHNYTLQSHSNDSNLHGKSLEAFGTNSMYSKDFISQTPPAMTDSILIGKESGVHFNSLTQDGVILIGTETGQKGVGTASIGIGQFALRYLFNGSSNLPSIAIGRRSLEGISGQTIGSLNIAIGDDCMKSLTAGYRNISIGHNSSKNISTGANNVVVANYGAASNSLTNEISNVLIGTFADITAGNNHSIALGYFSKCTASNQMMIGSTSPTTGINQIVSGQDATCDLGSTGLRFKNCYLSGNLSCANLTVSGELKVVNTSIVEISDNAIKLASGNIADTMDSGVYAQYNDGTAKYTGLIRNSGTGTYHLFDGLATEPTSTTDFANTTEANLICGHLTATTATIDNRTPHGALVHHITNKSVGIGENALPNISGQNNACFGYRAGSELTGALAWRNTIIGSRNDVVHSSEFFPTTNSNLTMLGYHVSVDNTQNTITPIEYSIGIGSRCIIRKSRQCVIGGWYGDFQLLEFVPGTNNMCDLGTTTYKFKNLNISSNINQLLVVDDSNNRVVPNANGTRDLGAGTLRWNDIYSVNSPIHSSDRNLKTDIISTPLGLNFINKLNPVQYRFKDGKRPHQGLIAQEVRDVINDMKTDFGGYITGYQKTKVDILDEKTNQKIGEKEEVAESPYYALRYTEFIGPLIKAVQELSARVRELESKIN